VVNRLDCHIMHHFCDAFANVLLMLVCCRTLVVACVAKLWMMKILVSPCLPCLLLSMAYIRMTVWDPQWFLYCVFLITFAWFGHFGLLDVGKVFQILCETMLIFWCLTLWQIIYHSVLSLYPTSKPCWVTCSDTALQ